MTARTIQFHLAPASNTKLHRLEALTEEIALALGVRSARLSRREGILSVEVPRADSQFVSLAELVQKLDNDDHLKRAAAVPGTAILGVDGEGVPLLLRLSSPDVAHCLIAGTTGSGKTELARTIIASLTLHQKPRDLQLALFDPKQHGLAPFAHAPHLLFPLAFQVNEMSERLSYLVSEMEHRDRELCMRPRIVIVVDELADVIETGGTAIDSGLTRLVQRGRSAGVSVIACTQKPTARAVGTLMKANFAVRLVGRVASAEDARVAAGVGGTGAERLAGRGDFLLVAGGEIIRFQVAMSGPAGLARGTRLELSQGARSAPERSGVDRAEIFGRLRRVK